MIVVTGATGQLGRLVIKSLLTRIAPDQIVAAVRSPGKAADLASQGVQVREADYGKPATLDAAFAGATRVLLISSTSLGLRVAEHKAVIDAAKKAGVQLLAYTSVINADNSTLLVTPDHVATEQYLIASGIPWVLLRNGWYFENRTANLVPAVQHAAIFGCSGDGRISAAARADFADAAAVVLATPGHAGKTYELAGDEASTAQEFAAEVSKQVGKKIAYTDLPENKYQELLEQVGLPPMLAHLVADSDTKAKEGQLYSTSRDLAQLIGRPTTSLSQAIAAALHR